MELSNGYSSSRVRGALLKKYVEARLEVLGSWL